MDPFLGEIKILPWDWAPNGYLPCDGRLVQITQYSALYSLLGVYFGGDGRTTFGLPDLRGRISLCQGQQPNNPNHTIGQFGGAEGVTLTQAQMPAHTHAATFTPSGGTPPTVNVADADATLPTPKDNVLAKQAISRGVYANMYAPATAANAHLGGVAAGSSGGTVAVASTGNGAAVKTLPPYLTLNYVIATMGIYPTRS